MDGLGDGILIEILLRVPAWSLARLKWTNKRLRALVSHPAFVESHLERWRNYHPASQKILKTHPNNHPLRAEMVRMDSGNLERKSRLRVPTTSSFPRVITRAHVGGTCDGLVCLVLSAGKARGGDIICLWNPTTGELRQLPILHNCRSARVGLGYDRATDDYKVVALDNRRSSNGVPARRPVHVWTRKTSTWRRSVSDTPWLDSVHGSSIYLWGALHWVAHYDGHPTSHAILSFDLAGEKFEERRIPNHISCPIGHCPTLGIHGDGLCLYTTGPYYAVGAWIVGDAYGLWASSGSWCIVLAVSAVTIPNCSLLIPARAGPDGTRRGILHILALRNCRTLVLGSDSEAKLSILYDAQEEETVHKRPSDIPRWGSCRFHVYEESIVSPYSGEEGAKSEEVARSPSSRKPRPLLDYLKKIIKRWNRM